MDFKKVDRQVGGLINDNVRKLESVFPSVVKDGEVDFGELKELLGDFKEVDKEKYEMNWVGKKEAKKIALTPLFGKTLKYIEGDGKNEDTTENLYIEGDNLEVLKLLQNSYYGKVKMIYIDPPYNTGNDFVYNDNFREKKEYIDTQEGNINECGERLVKNQKTSSHYHSKWMNMMYSRLLVCKNLLKDDGVIFISIDDNEVFNLKKLCDEILGEENFVTQFIWEKKKKPSFLHKNVGKLGEYILCYVKDENKTFPFSIETTSSNKKYPLNNAGNNKSILKFKSKSVKFAIEDGVIKAQDMSEGNIITKLLNDLQIKNGLNQNDMLLEGEWRYSQERLDQIISNGEELYISKIPFRPNHIRSGGEIKKMKNFLSQQHYNCETNEDATSQIIELLKFNAFDYCKPVKLIKLLTKAITYEEDECIILDFFSGSSTAAHSVMQLNAEDNGNRKFIMVQLPEETDEKSEAYKAGYKNICEIGKERIKRAGEKILEENKDKEGIENLDIGFKVFRVENSNIIWQNQLEKNGQIKYDLYGKNIDDIDFVPHTKDIDVVYEILLRHYGIPLTAKIEKLDFIGNRTYAIQDSIIVCLETQITKDIVDKISELEPIKVIFRDSAFREDISLKQNSIHRLNILIEKNNKNTTHVVEFI